MMRRPRSRHPSPVKASPAPFRPMLGTSRDLRRDTPIRYPTSLDCD